MNRIKICGLFRDCDTEFVNRAMPDYVGLVFVERSHRNVSSEQARALRGKIDPAIRTVGVFADAPIETIARLYREGIIEIAQLHGNEDEKYIARLRASIPDMGIWKAYKIRTSADRDEAAESIADLVLLDGGAGEGARFNWELIRSFPRPFILAGGLTPENIPEALALHPYAVDLSTGVEKGRVKNEELILAAVAATRGL